MPIFLLGAVINTLVVIAFFNWSPNPEEYFIFYGLAGLWGMADAVWQTQINGEHYSNPVINFLHYSCY